MTTQNQTKDTVETAAKTTITDVEQAVNQVVRIYAVVDEIRTAKSNNSFIKGRMEMDNGFPTKVINIWGIKVDTMLDLYDFCQDEPDLMVQFQGTYTVKNTVFSDGTAGNQIANLNFARVVTSKDKDGNKTWVTKEMDYSNVRDFKPKALSIEELAQRRAQNNPYVIPNNRSQIETLTSAKEQEVEINT